MQDRAGYYICWGCLVYLPTVYTSMTAYMVTHDAKLSPASTSNQQHLYAPSAFVS